MEYQTMCFCQIIKSVLRPEEKCEFDERIKWTFLVQLAKEQNILPLFVEGATKYSPYVSRPEYGSEMQEVFATVASQVKRTNAFLKLYKAFTDEGIYPLVLKGLVCRELYRKLRDHRPSGDEDILISLSEYWRAKDVLIANGYIAQIESETEAQLEQLQEVSFIHPKERLHIELHLNPMGRENFVRSRMSDYFKNVFKDYREVEIQGVRVRTMNHQHHLLFLILHAFRHFTGGGFGIRQMLDVLLYQERYGMEIDMKQLQETLQSFRADIFWSDLIHIGNLYFGFKLPILHSSNCPEELLEDMIRCGAFGNKTQAERTAKITTMIATEYRMKNASGNVMIMLWELLFPSRAYLVDCYPYLEEKPWLLPIEWLKRWGRFIKHNRKNNGNLAIESMKISKRRMQLLKKYDLI